MERHEVLPRSRPRAARLRSKAPRMFPGTWPAMAPSHYPPPERGRWGDRRRDPALRPAAEYGFDRHGCCGHSLVRAWMFGGVTHQTLQATPVCCLTSHGCCASSGPEPSRCSRSPGQNSPRPGTARSRGGPLLRRIAPAATRWAKSGQATRRRRRLSGSFTLAIPPRTWLRRRSKASRHPRVPVRA